MKKKTKIDLDRPVGKIRVVDDFLPSPKDLAKTFMTKKVTIDIEYETLEFFRRCAEKSGSKYQRLIREVLKAYAKRFSKAS